MIYNEKKKYYFYCRKYNDFAPFLMHKVLKYLISLCLLILVVTHGIIQFGMFEFFRADYRAEAARLIGKGVPKEGQVVFCLDIDDLKNAHSKIEWKDDKEFRFENKLYDVIRMDTSGDSVYIYCLYDEDDTMLYSVLDNLIEDDEDDAERTNGYGIFLNHYYCCENFDYNLNSPGADDNIYISPVINLLDGEYLLITPPPRSVI